jgi:hypothetical protein
VIVGASTDDLLMISESEGLLTEVKRGLKRHFEMTDLGKAHWLLGIEIRHDCQKCTMLLLQGAYVTMILGQFSMENANAVSMPLDPGQHLSKTQSPSNPEEEEDMAEVPYRELVGSLMYAAVATRPDVSYAITNLSQFLESPGCMH